MNEGILFAFLAMVCFGIHPVLVKRLSQKTGLVNSVFFKYLLELPIFLAIMLAFSQSFSLDIRMITIFAVFGLTGLLAFLIYAKSITSGSISVNSTIASSSAVIVVVLALLVYNEPLGPFQLLSIPVIFIGVVLTGVRLADLKNPRLSKGVPYSFMTMVMWGVLFLFMKIPIMEIGPLPAAFWLETSILLWSFPYLPFAKPKLPRKNDVPTLLSLSFVAVLGIAFYSLSVYSSGLAIAETVTHSAILLSILLSMMIYNDKMEKSQWLGILLVVTGVVLISL